jgi:CRP/FNR family transcriptional regulator
MTTLIASESAVPLHNRVQHNVTQLGSMCSACATRRVCQTSSLMQDVPVEIHNRIFQSRIIKTGKHLFHAGDHLTTLYVVKSGAFKTYVTSEYGDEYVTSFHTPGDILGADALAEHRHELSAVALENSAVCRVSYAKLETEVKRFSSDWIVKQACQQALRESHTFLISIRNNANAYARLSYFLIKQSLSHKARGHSEREFRLEMKRGDIANYLGLTIETVSRVLHRLQENAVLTVRGRHIAIHNLNKLHEIAELHPQHEKRLSA